MSAAGITRRDVLAGVALLLAGGALPALGGTVRSRGAKSAAGGRTVLLRDRRFALPDGVQRRLALIGARQLELEADPVRQWRGAEAHLLGARTTRLVGVTRWPEFLMVRGLAEESGRRVRHQQVDAASGALVWLID